MSTCWKCGKELEEGTECVPFCQYGVEFTQQARTGKTIDWNKVSTLEDVKLIFSCIGFIVFDDTPTYEQLKRFLKD